MNQKLNNRIILTCILVFMFVLPNTNKVVNAQMASNYFVTVKPTTAESQIYTTVGRNWTVSFEALWSYGDDSGNPIENAKVTIQVNNSRNEVVNTLIVNTTTGLFSFNYSLSTADILTFTPINLVFSNGTKWESNLLDARNSIYGFQSESVVIWWDTFQVSLVSYATETVGEAIVAVNVTYLLLPEEGLTLPEWATYSHQTFLPKRIHDANVTINGEKAQETSTDGIFTANVSIWLPTAFIHVRVSQEEWDTTHTGFSIVHTANEPLWHYPVIFSLVFSVLVMIYFRLLRKKGNTFFSLKNYPILGGVFLAVTSIVSLYWGLVGLDSTLHGFDWIILTVFGWLSFIFGLTASLLSLKKKIQALVIFVILMPIATNIIVVKSSFDMYGLANPWMFMIVSFSLSVLSAFFVCNSDNEFKLQY